LPAWYNLLVSGRIETWDLWFPGPGASGLPFARSHYLVRRGASITLEDG